MDNKTIYKRTFGFSLRRVFWDVVSVIVMLAIATLGFMLGEKFFENGIIGLVIGAIVGLVIMAVFLRFVSYRLKAGQIAMMTRAITDGDLPDDVIAEGKRTVKERFATVAAYFAVTGAIKGIFNQLGRGITKVGENLGGETGNAIGSAVSTAIQTLVAYLCDCCLGWVFYRRNVKAGKATCEGAVLFFRHGKTLARNVGRIFGFGLASLIVIGGVFTGIFYVVLRQFDQALSGIYAAIAEMAADSDSTIIRILQDPATLPIVFAVILALIVWAIIHGTFIKPFVLTGVLRNYLGSGMDEVPDESSFNALDSRSAKFRKLHASL